MGIRTILKRGRDSEHAKPWAILRNHLSWLPGPWIHCTILLETSRDIALKHLKHNFSCWKDDCVGEELEDVPWRHRWSDRGRSCLGRRWGAWCGRALTPGLLMPDAVPARAVPARVVRTFTCWPPPRRPWRELKTAWGSEFSNLLKLLNDVSEIWNQIILAQNPCTLRNKK